MRTHINEWNYLVYFILLADKTFILFSVLYLYTLCQDKATNKNLSEQGNDCRQGQMYSTMHKAVDSFLAQMELIKIFTLLLMYLSVFSFMCLTIH